MSDSASHPFTSGFDADAIEARLRELDRRTPYHFPNDSIPSHFRRSSVLLCFWRDADDLRILFTKRAQTLSGHAGQMSFPGGQLEPGESWTAAALRETEEEVGIARDRIEVLGRLDDAWSGAGHLIAPIVGWLEEPPLCIPNPAEVDEIHMPGLAGFFDPNAFSRVESSVGEIRFTNPVFSWPGGSVYGLSTDLLIEAIEWGLGIDGEHGRRRLERFRLFLRQKEKERASFEPRG